MVLVGAYLVFVDIDPIAHDSAVDRIAAAIAPRTKGMLRVRLFGRMPGWAPSKPSPRASWDVLSLRVQPFLTAAD